MPYGDQDKMINDLLASMNVSISSGDKVGINAQLAKSALGFKLLTPEYEAQIKADEEEDRAKKAKANSLTLMGENSMLPSDTSGGNDFNINNDDIAGMIQSLMS